MRYTLTPHRHLPVYRPEIVGTLLVQKTGGQRHKGEGIPIESALSVPTPEGEKLALKIAPGIDRKDTYILIEDLDDGLRAFSKRWSKLYALACFPSGNMERAAATRQLQQVQERMVPLLQVYLDRVPLLPEPLNSVLDKIGVHLPQSVRN